MLLPFQGIVLASDIDKGVTETDRLGAGLVSDTITTY
jgi:hypothetical protein